MISAVVKAVNVNPEGGVPKHSVDSAFLRKEGVEGDRQNDLKHHGGPDRAVCLFSSEVIEELRAEGHPNEAGFVGENVANVQENSLIIGSERIGKGSVSYFVDNPIFRAFWENGKLLLFNAVFLNTNKFDLK